MPFSFPISLVSLSLVSVAWIPEKKRAAFSSFCPVAPSVSLKTLFPVKYGASFGKQILRTYPYPFFQFAPLPFRESSFAAFVVGKAFRGFEFSEFRMEFHNAGFLCGRAFVGYWGCLVHGLFFNNMLPVLFLPPC